MSRLEVHQLVVSRGDRVVLDGLSFSVAAGEVLHILGRNGAGKTSLLEVLCGLRRADSGRIAPQPETRERHWVGHKNALNPSLSALENLQFWAALNGERLDDPRAALAAVGLLKPQQNRPSGQLSTGQKRRAALARLVAVPRRWWFLDEPLAGLDVQGLALFAELLGRHLAGGGAVLVTSHQPLPGELPSLRHLDLSAAA
ncbi:MAG: heme ABC exporter ATP-binding protein CcmA [Gammaproteobacteria bacterium]|uniref:heme ABC exporter ATP-binding protein CcmA n=1 Tax=Nevskia sp. TaxID=1929292 RepID=UPI00403581B6|nr:heme ABC exporter ATP-binding protein CcmA [Gammaproteobacteria bacterium]